MWVPSHGRSALTTGLSSALMARFMPCLAYVRLSMTWSSNSSCFWEPMSISAMPAS